MKKLGLLITVFVLSGASIASAHPKFYTGDHHAFLHQVAEEVAAGTITLKQAVEKLKEHPDFIKALEKDIQDHASELAAKKSKI